MLSRPSPTAIQVDQMMQGTACVHWRAYMLNNGHMMLVHSDHDVDPMGTMACFIEPNGKVYYGGEREAN